MSYSSAVKGYLTRSSMTSYILSQAELELRRPLIRKEEAMLFEMFSTQDIFNRIHKVCLNNSYYFPNTILLLSMVMGLSSFCCFCAISLSSNVMFRWMLHQGMETVFYMVIILLKWIQVYHHYTFSSLWGNFAKRCT